MATTPTIPATPAPATPKVSWLKKFGQEVVKVVDFVAGKAAPIAQAAGSVVSALLPQFAPEISIAENLVSSIAKQAQVTEATFAQIGQASNGPAKLQAVLSSVGPQIDQWVANSFPGAAAASATVKAGLVNAVVAVLNDVDPNLALAAPTPTAVSAAAAVKAALAAVKH
jgi:hypothetical protein